jgi:hypothetical protein
MDHRKKKFLLSLAWLVVLATALILMVMCQAVRKGPASPKKEPWFPHRHHVKEQSLECLACHETVKESLSADDNNLPRVKVCLNCHEKGDGVCPVCDRPPESAVPGRFKGRNLIFSHAPHLKRDVSCGDCHGGIEDATKKTRESHIPAMKTCMGCHEENKCAKCHVDLQAKGFKPKTHDPFWPEMHALSTRKDQARCEACHAQSWCQECHQGDRRTSYHDAAFINSHGLEARLGPGRCDRCHKTNFCINCHARVPNPGGGH